jgi:hypothetical protein
MVQVHTLRSVLQAVTILVTHYGYLVATKTELFLQRLLSGVNQATHLAQQVLCMNALRTICSCPPTVHFLYTTRAPRTLLALHGCCALLSPHSFAVPAGLHAKP